MPGPSGLIAQASLYIFTHMQMSVGAQAGPGGRDLAGPDRDPDGEADRCQYKVIDAHRVARTRSRLPDPGDVDEVAAMFKLMSDPKRLKILYALRAAGELCVCDIAATVGVSETGVSQAMRLLRSAGVVRRRREGRVIHYSLDDDHVAALVDMGLDHLLHSTADSAVGPDSAGGHSG